MKPYKACRRWLASMLVAVFVGLQLTAAAYACTVGPDTAGGAGLSTAMVAMPDCTEMVQALDDQQPQLCKAHCDQNKQTVNTSPPADPSATQVVDWLFSRLVLQLPPRHAEPPPAAIAALAVPPKGAPPVYLAFLVLRN